MKKELTNIVLLLIIGLFSCQQEESSNGNIPQKAIPVQVNIPIIIAKTEFAGEPSATKTVADKSSLKAAFNVAYTVPVNSLQTKAVSIFSNVWILQFNNNTCVVSTNLGTVTTGTNLTPTLITGTNQTIYIVANGPSAANAFTTGMTQTDFEESLTYTGSIAGDAQVPYVGNLTGVTVADGSLTSGSSLSPVITLSRIAAKVSLALDYNVSGYTLQSVEMYNAAKNMYYVLGKDVTTFPVTPSSTNINQSALPANIIPGTATSGTYTWYVGENKRGSGSITSPYQKDFLHTPGSSYYCTYIRIKSLKNDGSGKVLTYYLYPGENATTDFNVKRNWDYNLNVVIQGNASAQESCEGVDGRVRMATSNAYIVAPGSTITIPVNIKGNANEPLKEAPTDNATIGGVTHTATSVAVLWQSATSLINVSSIYNGKVNITASGTPGNAVVAAYNGSTILWSWHIWVTDYTPNGGGVTYTNTLSNPTRTFMERNLGATTISTATTTTYGCYYQWGRKDPFPYNITSGTYNGTATFANHSGGSVESANLQYTIQHPTEFSTYLNTTTNDWYADVTAEQNNNLWNKTDNTKTIYDPCPPGWRVPTSGAGSASPWYAGFTPSSGSYYTSTELGASWELSGGGYDFKGNTTKGVAYHLGFYPATGCRYYDSGLFKDMESAGACWSASVVGIYGGDLHYNVTSVLPLGNFIRAYGFPVRCCQE